MFQGESLVPQYLAREVFQNISTSAIVHHDKQLTAANPYDLNEQELKVLKYLAKGLSNKAISEMMFLFLGTVKNYVSKIY